MMSGGGRGNCVGIACSPSEQWEYCKVLVDEFTDDKLVQLCEHRNPVVRLYSFEALQEKCSDRVYGVLLKHLTDTAGFLQIGGCLGVKTTVGKEFLSRVDFVQKEQVGCGLSDVQWRQLDSLRKEIVVLPDNR
ncbi:hypothetical protein [Paraflavitalea sp. CAU 1676]|uniref:hypothetical protein n=1 Tax=Paraflavitalea sp. CAU 1676 TaxID=3032598 RepID=UPI0023DA4A37|nr:hypothetical protein [Paraflavitalea sp. CAU 1676]MDF2187966.1 hypothetical protein [Paraflavitalea sp. CAU 1676]